MSLLLRISKLTSTRFLCADTASTYARPSAGGGPGRSSGAAQTLVFAAGAEFSASPESAREYQCLRRHWYSLPERSFPLRRNRRAAYASRPFAAQGRPERGAGRGGPP